MQVITREMNFSECTFILSREQHNNGHDVRIFTPGSEVPFAGHPTLGTAWIIRKYIIQKDVSTVILNLKVGQISVTFEKNLLWMKQVEPIFGKTITDLDLVAASVNLSKDELDDRFPVQEVSTGLPFIIIPVKSLKSMKNASTNLEFHVKLLKQTNAKGVLLFCPEAHAKDHQLNVRVFAPLLGVPEDPATGSGNGCLAGYLVQHQYFGTSEIDVIVEQGYEINRPSLLHLSAKKKNSSIEVHVGGRVFLVAQGQIL